MTNPTGDPPEQAPTTPIVSWEAPADAAGPAPGVTFAGFGPRLLAYIIDAIIVGIVATVIALIAVVPIVADRGSGRPRARPVSPPQASFSCSCSSSPWATFHSSGFGMARHRE
jgi:uncharacterized RDD family membrane protein YckC